MSRRHNGPIARILAACLAVSGAARAELDLQSATLSRLDNGLTVILLEDRNFPVVSVQSLYRVGARDETTGQTGLAHFLEHMAFRASASFPGTGLVSEIYAVGGEWHGYTWTDQTTYFATVPKEHLDTLLQIEAERMSHLVIDAADMEAERGAVLAEMHGYENDASTVLFDHLLFASFLGHPYRNNTIGWQSDIENLRHEDVVAFYERHYVPANAVIAIVGDFDAAAVNKRIAELFGGMERRPATPLPHTVEPLQTGVRRVQLSGPAAMKHFKIAYRAPSASSADFAAFLVLQDWLGGSSGVSFLQNDWGTPVREDSLLADAADDLETWFPPSAQDYVFVISGSAAVDADQDAIEAEIERRVAIARDEPPDAHTLDASVRRVLDELVFDVETTEDAAHQLAFFDGLGAFDVLLALPDTVRDVTPEDVQRVARRYLGPERRTIGWWTPGKAADVEPGDTATAQPSRATTVEPDKRSVDQVPVREPVIARLRNGIPVILTESDLSSSAWLRVIVPGSNSDDPVQGHASLDARFRPDDFPASLKDSVEELAGYAEDPEPGPSSDPEWRLEQAFADIMGRRPSPRRYQPALLVMAGDIPAAGMLEALEGAFGALPAAPAAHERVAASTPDSRDHVEIHMGKALAQDWLGYVFPAPGPRDPNAYACRLLLYVLSHHYEGRLGKAAITERGLLYYIDSRYRSDGETAWVTLAGGVDPHKLDEFRELVLAELERLGTEPPTAAEIAEARTYLVGRAISAAQSNEELTAAQARDWLWYGRLHTPEELRAQLDQVSDDDVRAMARAFAQGTMITVTR